MIGSSDIKKPERGAYPFFRLESLEKSVSDYYISGKVHIDVNPGSIPQKKSRFRSIGDEKIISDKIQYYIVATWVNSYLRTAAILNQQSGWIKLEKINRLPSY
jgi:hypothetical protein